MYLLLYENDNQLIGAAICEVVREPTDGRMDALVFGRLQKTAWRFGMSMAPALICGPCGTYGTHLITHLNLPANKKIRIENYLIDSLESKAKELNL